MQTVGELARSVGLTRSTLLYYDRLGLLSPGGHCKGEYRLYSSADARRLEKICQYRKAGLSLKAIQRILDDCNKSEMKEILEKRLLELNDELSQIKDQQALLATLLGRNDLIREVSHLDKASWIKLLEAAGFSDLDMSHWHIHFEHADPQKHHKFLASLHIPEPEILLIRKHAAKGAAQILTGSIQVDDPDQ